MIRRGGAFSCVFYKSCHLDRNGISTEMQLSKNEFWDSTNVPSPLIPSALYKAEQELKVKLPAELIELLYMQNGGYTGVFVFPTKQATAWSTDHVPFDEMFGIPNDESSDRISMLDTNYMTQEWGLPEKQVIVSGDGHWFITLDYRKGPVPSIAWIDTEMEQDVQLAESFAKFFAGLVSKDDFVFAE